MDKSGYHCSNEGKYICRGINSTEREVIIPILNACHAAPGVASSSGSHNQKKMQTAWRWNKEGVTEMTNRLERQVYEETLLE